MLKKPTPTEERFSNFTPTSVVRLNNKHLHQCRCGFETHDGDRLPFAPPWQPIEGRAGAGEGAERGCAGCDGSLWDAEAVDVFHRAEGTTPRQRVYNLHTHTHTKTVCQHCFKLQAAEQGKARIHTRHIWEATKQRAALKLVSCCTVAAEAQFFMMLFNLHRLQLLATKALSERTQWFSCTPLPDLGTSWQATAMDAMKVVLPSAFHSTFAQVACCPWPSHGLCIPKY